MKQRYHVLFSIQEKVINLEKYLKDQHQIWLNQIWSNLIKLINFDQFFV